MDKNHLSPQGKKGLLSAGIGALRGKGRGVNGVSSHKDEGNLDLSNCIQNETGQVLGTQDVYKTRHIEENQGGMIFLIRIDPRNREERKDITIVSSATRSPPATPAACAHERPCPCMSLSTRSLTVHDVACHCMTYESPEK